jgi:hypothetical protein
MKPTAPAASASSAIPATHAYGKVAVFEDLYGNLRDLIGPAAP